MVLCCASGEDAGNGALLTRNRGEFAIQGYQISSIILVPAVPVVRMAGNGALLDSNKW